MSQSHHWRRERTARALCERAGGSPDALLAGRPAWLSYLTDADAVLQVLIAPDDWAAAEARD